MFGSLPTRSPFATTTSNTTGKASGAPGRAGGLPRLAAAQIERARAALADRLRAYQRPDGIHVVMTSLLAVASR